MNVTNFDGTNYHGATALQGGTVQFSGSIAATNASGRVGTLTGAFFNNGAVPAAGQAGTFGITGPNYTANGNFRAQK